MLNPRNVLPLSLLLCTTLLPLAASGQTAPKWETEDFSVVSGPASPRVAYAVSHEGGKLWVGVDVQSFLPDGTGTSIQLGAAAANAVMLTEKDAIVSRGGGIAHYNFGIPEAKLVAAPADWAKLKLAFAVAWASGLPGIDRQRERFLVVGPGASHLGLGNAPETWTPINLAEREALSTDRKNRLSIAFNQPLDGKATIVIEDAGGRRVRNLLSGADMKKGAQDVAWDGLDDDGRPVPPGTYRWRAISHPGIEPHHIMTFGDGPGSNHGAMQAATSNKNTVFIGTSVSEGGHQIAAFDNQGKQKFVFNPPNGMGLQRVALAADDKTLYIAKDGTTWGDKTDRSKPDWKMDTSIALLRYDLASGTVREFNRKPFVTISVQNVGPGSVSKRDRNDMDLRGMALLDGKLYISSRVENALLIVNPETGAKEGQINLPNPGDVAAIPGGLIAATGNSIVKLSPLNAAPRTIVPEGQVNPVGIAVDAAGQVYVSDAKTHTVRIFSPAGKPVRTLGTPGGEYKGKYDPQRMVNPRGLTVASDGKLWVAESRWAPKRYVAWDVAKGTVAYEYFGRPHYASPGGGIDPEDPSRWVALGCLWKVDMAAKTAYPTSVLGTMAEDITAAHYRFVRRDGRTYLIALGKNTFVSLLQDDGSAKDVAMIGTVAGYAHDNGWVLPPGFKEAFEAAIPEAKGNPRSVQITALWVDRNGDGAMQPDEFQFAKSVDRLGNSGWGCDFVDLTLREQAWTGNKPTLVTLTPDGFYPGGAPKYPSLDDAIKAAVPMETLSGKQGASAESMTDYRGDLLINSTPKMSAFGPDGKIRWTYPNLWTNVHGSHEAPLPQTGVLQGVLFFTGLAPLDEAADVFVLNGNHGRLFVMTTDGLYLDEMFKDVRMGGVQDVYMAGGEIFGGIFEKSRTDGKYYLQVGGNEFRVFEVSGLNGIKRQSGTISVSAAQATAAENALERRAAGTGASKVGQATLVTKAPMIDGKDRDWTTAGKIEWNKSGQFPVAVRVNFDAKNLYLFYDVRDDSPWVNNGKDWQSLFKTGDAVTLELGTDPKARANRNSPVPGDLRLLIAPYMGKDLAVLYRHRLPGATDSVVFQSPWREEKVDSVQRLADAQVAVTKDNLGYHLEAAIPLATLGLAAPAGQSYKADFGVIYGDTEGTINLLRNYWSNQATGLVNDVPGEIMLSPNLWGTLSFGGGQ